MSRKVAVPTQNTESFWKSLLSKFPVLRGAALVSFGTALNVPATVNVVESQKDDPIFTATYANAAVRGNHICLQFDTLASTNRLNFFGVKDYVGTVVCIYSFTGSVRHTTIVGRIVQQHENKPASVAWLSLRTHAKRQAACDKAGESLRLATVTSTLPAISSFNGR